jgi:hypothetical protein
MRISYFGGFGERLPRYVKFNVLQIKKEAHYEHRTAAAGGKI